MRISSLAKFHFFISSTFLRLIRLKILIIFCSIVLSTPCMAQTSEYYGTNWGADGLANTIIGKYAGRQADYRFRAEYTGSVIQIRLYIVYAPGYGSGTGGKLTVSLETDDGTVNHLPSGIVLTSFTDNDPMRYGGRDHLTLYTFMSPGNLIQGKLYHLHFTNSDSDPMNNYISINELWVDPPGDSYDRMPTGNVTDLALLRQEGTEPWVVSTGHTPIFTLYSSDSRMQGQGYIGAPSGTPRNINGTNLKVRSNITISGASKTVNKVWVRLKKVSGIDNLIIRLENSNGTLIEEGTVSSSTINISMTWVSVTFLTTHTLSSGSIYHVVLSTGSGTTYQTYPIQDGSVDYGFVPMFSDGHFEYAAAGSNWTDATTSYFKAQIFFSVQPVSITEVSVTGVGGSNTITTDKGTLQLISTVLPANAPNKTVAWSIVNGTGRASISSSGLVTAIGNGTVTVRATANDGSGVYGTILIAITNQVIPVTGIVLSGAGGAITITTNNGTLQLSAVVSPSNATNKNFIWSIVNGSGQASISPTGLVTAIANGTATARATASYGSGANGTLFITITNQIVTDSLVLVNAVIENSTPAVLEVVYSSTVADVIPATSAFSVIVNSTDRNINTMTISGTKVLLTLASPVANSDIITVTYSKPSANPLQAASGGQAASVGPLTVTNKVSPKSYVSKPVKIFPNPAHDFINIQIVEPTLVPDFIRIICLTGKIVFQDKVKPAIKDFRIPIKLMQGVYILLMGSGNQILFTQKLIVAI